MALLTFFLILIVLVVVHELGHFTAAKLFGIKVEEFGIFFPPRLWAKKVGETEYSFNALPLGGFVRIFGEQAEDEASLSPQELRRSFAHQPRTVQVMVLVAGILCNFIFAWLVLSAGYMVGLPTPVEHKGFGTVHDAHVYITDVVPNSPAKQVGIEPGDIVVAAETATTKLPEHADAAQFQQFITDHGEQSVVLSVMRGSEQKNFVARPADGLVEGRKALGVALEDAGTLTLSPGYALLQGGIMFWVMTKETAIGLVTFFGTLFHGTADLSQVSGPIGIAVIGASAVKAGFAMMVTITAIISINLGLLNLLPIPGLDGGRVFITLIEGARGRALPQSLVTKLTIGGLALLIALMLLVSFHDVAKLIG